MNIIELANDSGLVYYGMGKDRARFIHHLENFADLVAAAARAAEREACAKLCESNIWSKDVAWWREATKSEVSVESSVQCAAAIRARGTT